MTLTRKNTLDMIRRQEEGSGTGEALDSQLKLRTFEDARLEIVAYVEEKFGLRIGNSKPSDTGLREHSDPMDVDAVNSLSSVKGKWSSVRPTGV